MAEEKVKTPKPTLLNVDKRLRAQEEMIASMAETIQELSDEIQNRKKTKPSTINKIETYNKDKEPVVAEERAIKMDAAAKIESVRNACKILPPNLQVAGRHTRENVSAICGFKVSEEQMDAAYDMMEAS